MDRRCLLVESAGLRELKLDGPALCLRGEGKSRQWFPLQRLSLVSCIGMPALGVDALLATAHQGIPVSIYTRSGKLTAQIIHPGNLPGPLSHWLEAVPCDETLKNAYNLWLENQSRHTYAMIGAPVRDRKLSAVRADARLRSLAKAAGFLPLLAEARNWAEGLVTGIIQSQAARLGVSPNSAPLSTVIADLRPLGVTLGLTWLVESAGRDGSPEPYELPFHCGKQLAPGLEQWVERALFTLGHQLERCAMDQDKTPGAQ